MLEKKRKKRREKEKRKKRKKEEKKEKGEKRLLVKAEEGIREGNVNGVQTCAIPI